jgi:hypothetical protein
LSSYSQNPSYYLFKVTTRIVYHILKNLQVERKKFDFLQKKSLLFVLKTGKAS